MGVLPDPKDLGRIPNPVDRCLAIARAMADATSYQAVLRQLRTRAVWQLHDEGWTMRDIAEAIGVSYQRVHQIISGTDR